MQNDRDYKIDILSLYGYKETTRIERPGRGAGDEVQI